MSPPFFNGKVGLDTNNGDGSSGTITGTFPVEVLITLFAVFIGVGLGLAVLYIFLRRLGYSLPCKCCHPEKPEKPGSVCGSTAQLKTITRTTTLDMIATPVLKHGGPDADRLQKDSSRSRSHSPSQSRDIGSNTKAAGYHSNAKPATKNETVEQTNASKA